MNLRAIEDMKMNDQLIKRYAFCIRLVISLYKLYVLFLEDSV